MEELKLGYNLDVMVSSNFKGETTISIEKNEYLFQNILLSILNKDGYKSLLKVLSREELIELIGDYNTNVDMDEPEELIKIIKEN